MCFACVWLAKLCVCVCVQNNLFLRKFSDWISHELVLGCSGLPDASMLPSLASVYAQFFNNKKQFRMTSKQVYTHKISFQWFVEIASSLLLFLNFLSVKTLSPFSTHRQIINTYNISIYQYILFIKYIKYTKLEIILEYFQL